MTTTESMQRLALKLAGSFFHDKSDLPAERAYNSFAPKMQEHPSMGEDSREDLLNQRIEEKDLRDMDRGRRLDKVIELVAKAAAQFAKKVNPTEFGGEISMLRDDHGHIVPTVTSRADKEGRALQATNMQTLLEKFSLVLSSFEEGLHKIEEGPGVASTIRTATAEPGSVDRVQQLQALHSLRELVRVSTGDLLAIQEEYSVNGIAKAASLLDLPASVRIIKTLLSQLNLAIAGWVEHGEPEAKRCMQVSQQASKYLEGFGADVATLASKVAGQYKRLQN